MRHLHFTQSLEPLQGGGLGTSALALHAQFLALGVASELCATHGGMPQSPGTGAREFKRIKPDPLYLAPALAQEAPALVQAAEVLHGHGLYVGTNYLLGREARRQGKPLVYHAHGFFEPWILNRSRWKKRLAHWLFEDANFRHACLWRALSEKEAEQIRSCGITAPIVVAPNGVDPLPLTTPAGSGAVVETPWAGPLTKTGPRLLFLGRLHPKKGFDLLLAAWARLAATHQPWQLVLAGPDEGGHLAVLKRQAASLGLLDRLVLTGPISGAPKAALLHSADLFVLPSYSEGFPMAVLEALACGVPVVATRACNFPDLSRAGCGWECEPTVESLTTALRAALDAGAPELRQRGSRGLALVQERYTWPRVARDLLDACAAHCRH